MLSGFLLYRPFASARLDRRRMPSIGRYAKRRFFRVIPGYWVALVTIVWAEDPERPRLVRFVEQRAGACWAAAVALFLVLGFVVGNPSDILHVAGVVIALLLVAPAVLGDPSSGRARRLLSLPVIAGLGIISYGIILWNER